MSTECVRTVPIARRGDPFESARPADFWPGWPVPLEVDLAERENPGEVRAEPPTARPEMYRPLQARLEKALRGYGSFTRQHGNLRVCRGAAAEFKAGFAKDHRRALDRLLFKVALGELSKREAVELLLPVLVDVPSRQLNAVFDAILALGDPASTLDVALSEYDRTGRERFLSLAVSLVEQSGSAGWLALEQLARSRRPECELFIDAIARCEGVAVAQRKRVLSQLLHHPQPDVRIRVTDALAELQADDRADTPIIAPLSGIAS